jgi:hypothetical protein
MCNRRCIHELTLRSHVPQVTRPVSAGDHPRSSRAHEQSHDQWASGPRSESHQSKMLRPEIAPGMKQSEEAAGLGVKPGNVRTLKTIAMGTSEGEIAVYSFASVLPGQNVIDLEWQRESKLRNETVLATLAGPLPDRPGKLPIHCRVTRSAFLRSLLALDCITARRRPICR